MRILMPCAAFPPSADGGGSVSSMILAKMLLAEGHDVRVVNVGDADRHEDVEGVPVHRIVSPNVYWNYRVPRPLWRKVVWHALENGNPWAYAAMRREISDFQPDLMLTVSIENVNVASWAAARSADLPIAHTVFSAFMMCWNGVMQKSGLNCQGQCASCRAVTVGRRCLSSLVDSVIGESHDILNRHREQGYFPNAQMYRVPAAIDGIHASTARSYPHDRPFRVGFLGMQNRFKGFGVLAEAARALADEPGIEFVLGGTGDAAYVDEMRALFPADRTKVLGWTTAEAFFPQVDCLIYPTIGREAFGRASIEAFSHAVPVISTSIGGVAENIQAGVNGFHVEPEDVIGLRDRILGLAKAPDVYECVSRGALASAGDYLKPAVGKQLSDALEQTHARHATGERSAQDAAAS